MAARLRSRCLVVECDRPAAIRGLCRKCYLAARHAMLTEVVTEEELIAAKLLKPPHTTPQSDFRSQLEQLLAKRRTVKRCEPKSQSA